VLIAFSSKNSTTDEKLSNSIIIGVPSLFCKEKSGEGGDEVGRYMAISNGGGENEIMVITDHYLIYFQ
jgi:hypothetical protein